MAQSLDFSDLGAKTVQPPPTPTGSSAPGATGAPPVSPSVPAQASRDPGNWAPLDFSYLGARPVLAEAPAHEQPGFFERAYQTSGIKGMIDSAKARADEDEAVRSEALSHIKSSNWGGAAEVLLHHLARRAGTAAMGPGGEMISNAAQSTFQHGKAAYQAARGGQTGEAIAQAAEAVPLVGPVAAQIGEPLGQDIKNRNWNGAAGDVVSGGIQAALALVGGRSAAAEAGDTMSAEETAAKGLPLKAAGQRIVPEVKAAEQPATQFPRNPDEVQAALGKAAADNKGLPPKQAGQAAQQETQAARTAKGQQVGAAKEVLKKSLPTNVRSDTEYLQQALKDKGAEPDAGFVRNPYTDKEFGDLTPKQQSEILQKAQDLKTSETGQIPFPKNGEAVQTAKAIRDELGEEKLGLKDPNSPLGKLTNKLISGKNPNEGDLSFSFEDAENARKALNQEIKSEFAKFKAGGDGTLYRRLVDLKSSFDEDLYNSWEQHGDASAAQNVRQLGREYAGIVKEQYTGAAKNLFKTQNPEKIIPNLVSSGAKAQSTAESLLKNMSPSGKQTFADSLEREIYSQATKPDGTIDAVKARGILNKMGQTARTVLGDDRHSQLSTFLGDAASKQAETGQSVLAPAQVNSPERLVYDIVSNGPKAQTQVEGLMSKLSPTSQKVLRDSALREIYRQNTFPGSGGIDMAGAQRDYAALGDTAKTLFGPDHATNSQFLDAAAQEQAAKTAATNKPSLISRATNKLSRMTGAGVGAYLGGPYGAAAGDMVAGSLFEQARSGAVRIGISPTERIILSPKSASASRSLLTQFLKAKATGQTAALTAAYNALAAKQNGDNQTDSGDQSQPSSSTGGSPIGSILAGGRL